MAFFRQLAALLWKGLIVRIRNPIVTVFEVFVPIIAFIAIGLYLMPNSCESENRPDLPSKGPDRPKEPRVFKPADDSKSFHECEISGRKCFSSKSLVNLYLTADDIRNDSRTLQVYYTPSNGFTDDLMNELKRLTNYKTVANKMDKPLDVEKKIKNESDIRKQWMRDSDPIGLIFDAIPTESSTLFDYRLVNVRVFGKAMDRLYERDSDVATQDREWEGQYRYQLCRFQIMLNEALLSKLTKDNNRLRADNETVKWVERLFPTFPNIIDLDSTLNSLIAFLISCIVILVYAVMCTIIVKRLTDEKNGKVKELMRMMGMSDWVFWLSHFIHYFVVILVHSVVITWVFVIYKCPIFHLVQPLVFSFVFIVFGVQLILFCMAMSTFFDRPVMGILGMLVIHIFTFAIPLMALHPIFGSLPNKRNTSRLFSALLPNMAFLWQFDLIIRHMRANGGFGFGDLTEISQFYRALSVFQILMVQLAAIILYCFLIWYFDAVWPSEYGIAKPFYFLCMPSYYCPSRAEHQTQRQTTNTEVQSEDFESDPNLKASISLSKVKKVFGSGKGVHGVSLNIFEGQITALLGHNGAGKTTTMNMITGIYGPDSGLIKVNGYDIVTSTKKARSSLGLCPQDNVLFNDLSVRQHLQLFATLKDFPSNRMNEEINKILSLIRLKEKADSKSKTLSGGMKRRLSLGNAMVGESQILILDEPSSGLDPEARRAIWDVLQDVRRQKTILLTTHYMEEADALADRIAIMSEGRLKCSGSTLFLKKRFGAGYHLRITKSQNFNRRSVDSVIQKYLPDARVKSEINTEIIYALESEDKTKETNKDVFPDLFDDLDANKSELGIGSYGISVTTMEDVFIKVGSPHEVQTANVEDGTTQTNIDQPKGAQYKRLDGSALFFSRVKGLLLKRWHFWRRYWPLFLFQILFPVLVYIGAFLIEDYLRKTFEVQNMSLDLNINQLYPNSKGFFTSNDTYWQNFGRDFYLPNARRHTMTTELLDNEDPNQWLIKEAMTVGEEQYFRKYVIGGAVKRQTNGIALEFWWNPEATHSFPISINLMYESLIGHFVPDLRDKITILTRNVPFNVTGDQWYFILLTVIIICAMILPLAAPLMTASYVLFPIHERSSNSKFLQLMSGLSATTFWLCNYLWDITSHAIAIVFITIVIYIMDTYSIFFFDWDTTLSLILLLLIFGIASIAMAYFFSFLFRQPPNGFTILFLICLAIGFFLHFYFLIYLAADFINTREGSTAFHWMDIFRLVPTLSFNIGISRIYLIGSGKSFCHRLAQKMDLRDKCETDPTSILPCCDNLCGIKGDEDARLVSCFKSKKALSFTYHGVLIDICYLISSSILFFVLVLLCEANIKKFWSNRKTSNYQNRKESDSDVVEERARVKQLIHDGRTSEEAIVVNDLTKWFGNFLAVDHLTFAVHKNECFGLLGVNGAGKTTTFTMLTGEVMANEGTAFIGALDLRKNTKLYQRNIGYCPQFDALLDRLTGEEMLYLFGRLRGIPSQHLKSEVDDIIATTDNKENIRFITKNYSGGTKRKLSLGISIIGSPSLVFLDEPTAGVDPVARRVIWKTLNELKNSRNSSIILTSHSMEESEALCARIGIMVKGEFKCLGSVQQLRSKFGLGFTLMVKMKRQYITKEYLAKVHQFITQNLPSAQTTDFHECILHYKLSDTSVKWSTMFRVMQTGVQELDLEDYTLSDTTLEQIFIAFAQQK